MTYVFDTSSIRVLRNFYPDRFPSFWQRFDGLAASRAVISVREVRRELDLQLEEGHLRDWVKRHPELFPQPSAPEMEVVGSIFAVPHFQALVAKKAMLMGNPVADPFVIASAKVQNGTVVTEESARENAAKIPNICEHFGVGCMTLEVFLEQCGWSF